MIKFLVDFWPLIVGTIIGSTVGYYLAISIVQYGACIQYMKYDPEYNSYKFSSAEISAIVHSLIHYSADPFLDKITHKNVLNLLESIYKANKIPVVQ